MKSTAQPRVGVVIVSYESGEVLFEAIDAAAAQEAASRTYLVDNASSVVPSPPSRSGLELIAMQQNEGYASAVNAGARAAFADGCTHILFMNADVVLGAGAVGVMLAAWHPGALVAPRYGLPTAETQPSLMSVAAGAVRYDFLSGACLLVGRSDFERLGGLDERFFHYFEDTDLSWRAQGLGMSLVVADAWVRHAGGDSLNERSAGAQYYYTRNQITHLTHRTGRSPAYVVVRFLGSYLLRHGLAVRSRLRGKGEVPNAVLSGAWAGLRRQEGPRSAKKLLVPPQSHVGRRG
jgi:N-acetylglucosaminyl-diphospho-decaprenol L-rhamnosyltransferase